MTAIWFSRSGVLVPYSAHRYDGIVSKGMDPTFVV